MIRLSVFVVCSLLLAGFVDSDSRPGLSIVRRSGRAFGTTINVLNKKYQTEVEVKPWQLLVFAAPQVDNGPGPRLENFFVGVRLKNFGFWDTRPHDPGDPCPTCPTFFNVTLDESSLQSVTYTNRTSPEGVLITQQIQRIDVPYVEDGESKVTTFNFTTEQAERDTHFIYGGWVVPLSADGMKMTLEFSNLPHGNRSAGDVAQGSYVFIQFDVLLKAQWHNSNFSFLDQSTYPILPSRFEYTERDPTYPYSQHFNITPEVSKLRFLDDRLAADANFAGFGLAEELPSGIWAPSKTIFRPFPSDTESDKIFTIGSNRGPDGVAEQSIGYIWAGYRRADFSGNIIWDPDFAVLFKAPADEMGGGETTNVAAVAAGVSVAIIVVAGAAGFGIWYRRKSQMKSANKLAQSKLQSHYSTEPAKVAVQERTTWERSTITDRVSTLQADL